MNGEQRVDCKVLYQKYCLYLESKYQAKQQREVSAVEWDRVKPGMRWKDRMKKYVWYMRKFYWKARYKAEG